MLIIPYPDIHPEIFSIGPFAIGNWSLGPFAVRWYALAYIAGLIIGWRYCLAIAKRPPQVARPQDIDDFLVWATIGVVLGGRIGYIVFYNFDQYAAHPIEVLYLWRGGMSFHGGALGVMVAIILFCRQRAIPMLAFADIIACAVPIGGAEPRHPSQLYEACLEGAVLFAVLWALQRLTPARRRPGTLTGVFLMGYAIARIIVEFFRQPDAQLGFLFWGITMGQLLSLPLLLVGLSLALPAPPGPAEAGTR